MNKPAYRPDIDGLRAVAVVGVVFYHYGAAWLPGGFTGVDVFFVISGYLITTILRREIEAGDFSILGFYDRRIRRIVPALLVVLAATIAAGWFILMPGDYADLGVSAAYAAAGLGNLYFYGNTGYFDQASEMQPLLHTWSLGVEEQFYVLWPVALLTGMSVIKSQRLFIALLSAGALLTFAYAARRVGYDPIGAFYLPHPRAWELAIGALLAFMPAASNRWLSQLMAAFGAALIVWSLLLVTVSDPFPGINAVYACVGAALLIWPKRETLVTRALSLRPLVGVGLISYSLYLWHWPVLVLYRQYSNNATPTPLEAVVLGCASMGMAYLSWRFVEVPFRKPFSLPWKSVATGAVSVAGVAFVGAALSLTHGVPQRFPIEVQQVLAMEAYDYTTDARYPACWLGDNDEPRAFAAECLATRDSDTALTVAVWGDSHAARLYPGLRNVLPEAVGLTQYTRNSCPPMSAIRPACSAGNEAVLTDLGANPPDVLVMYAAWPNYGGWGTGSSFPEKLAATIASAKRAGIPNIWLVGPAPIFRPSLPELVVDIWTESGSMPDRLPGDIEGTVRETDLVLRAIATAAQIEYFSPSDALCNDEGCKTHTDRSFADLVTWDYGHLTTSGAEMMVVDLVEKFKLDVPDPVLGRR